ncbi:MAG: hypothetical protein DHS20C13_14290 [Thermodesulfobacteriota bacterium]|nr:MAG: hypothetical protein DHS20C13_14290 [Thermodesulfobacteriota bacterium]
MERIKLVKESIENKLPRVKNRISKKSIIDAIVGSGGSVSLIAQRCGVTRQTIYRWFERHPDLSEHVERDRELWAEIALNNVLKSVSNGNHKACTQILEKYGKHLGWGKSPEEPGGISKVEITYVTTPETEPYSDGTKNLQSSR